ncbi:phenylalanine--tRNA ligase subunit beta [Salinicola sp. MH3R3-1]|uniref:phenylalanine--tRNA ligase subunit beta n=1 Tax=Salinicola sp. MH3R3-1 TaxID=1928762 RepID=UPI00094EDC55|nr:phenylalanine--tRNA ligase subunit beta [Salinicola sp. MH3R3-1]OLO06401.1 phenylalanine--tRNA ligase subunit beta [Salinicola sp. MH3R3-1]
MKFSEAWLREWVSPALDTQALADAITMAGLEVDAVEPVGAIFEGVVVATVIAKAPHPDADKLNVCQVDDGSGEPVQVVCGAPNVDTGQKVPFARVGAVLPDNFKIKQAKLRGVESRGMICSASELGLEEGRSEGIYVLPADAPVGKDFRAWLQLDDHTIEVDLTPNRGDCLSLRGMAREVGCVTGTKVNEPGIATVVARNNAQFPVVVSDGERCPRYLGRVIRDVDITASTPLWMCERLRRSGIRSIDPAVDVTNYVMLELGQPMHAFDLDALNGGIEVRRARSDERLTLLDGQEVVLDGDTLVIADHDRALAIAGVMGGEATGVSGETRNLFLEAAYFSPLAVAGKAREFGLHTDASHRFERGVDPDITRPAMERATELLTAIVGGSPGPITEVRQPAHLPRRPDVELRRERLSACLGIRLPDEDIQRIFRSLGMTSSAPGQSWHVQIPSWRFDISVEEDLIEEIARIHGYNRLPVRRPQARLSLTPDDEASQPLRRLRRHMVSRGYQEAVTYSFVSPELQALITPGALSPTLANPISSDMSVMRHSLFPGLIKALIHNLNRQQQRVRLFETGLVFQGELDALVQTSMFGGLICGSREVEGWFSSRDGVDFFDLKGDLESLIALSGEADAWSFIEETHPALHPGRSARLYRQGKAVGWLGALHPAVRAELGIKPEVYLFEVEQEALTRGVIPRFTPLSRFPEVRRDLAFVVSDDVGVAPLLDAIRARAGEWLTQWQLFDVYQGKGVEEGFKSIALGLTWQHPSRTLNDEEINQLIAGVVEVAQTRFGATLRS